MGVLSALYFMLPAYTANILPPLLKGWNILNAPMDFRARLCGKRIFGEHKTWRGFIVGTIAGTAVFVLQKWFTPLGSHIALLNYPYASIWLGVLLSAGALIGDAVKSFFKRQLNISPGKPWLLFDQLDYIAGALLLASPLFLPSLVDIVWIIVLSLLFTVIIKHIGYYIGVNKVEW